MRHLKTFELLNTDMMTHEWVKKCGTYLEEDIGLLKYEKGYRQWYTNNWCFERNDNDPFFCNYFFYFEKNSPEINKLEQWLIKNDIEYFRESAKIHINFTEYYFEYLRMKEDTNISDIDIEEWFAIQRDTKKFNI